MDTCDIRRCSRVDENGVTVYKRNVRLCLSGVSDQLLIVTVIGPYQVGKSSFISHLTGDESIQIGNRIEEQTRGVWIYGPYWLNALKQRWQVPEVMDDKTKVIFIDTEGFGGESAGRSHEENKILMSQLISPYVAISQVCLMMHQPNLTVGSTEMFTHLLDVVQRVLSGVNEASSCKMWLIDISTGFNEYRTGETDGEGRPIRATYQPEERPQDFDLVSRRLAEVQCGRLTRNAANRGNPSFQVAIDRFWPLPNFNADFSIARQGDRFNSGFRIVVGRLLSILDEIKQGYVLSGIGACESFNHFSKNLDKENLEELAKASWELAQKKSIEQKVSHLVTSVVKEYKADISEMFAQLEHLVSGLPKTPFESDMNFEQLLLDHLERLLDPLDPASEPLRASPIWKKNIEQARKEMHQIGTDAKCQFLEGLVERQKGWAIEQMILVLEREHDMEKAKIASSPSYKYSDVELPDRQHWLTVQCKSELDNVQAALNLPDKVKDEVWQLFAPRITEVMKLLVQFSCEVVDDNVKTRLKKIIDKIVEFIKIEGTILSLAALL